MSQLRTLFARGESDADVLFGLDAEVESGAQCQAEGLVGSMTMVLIAQPDPVFVQISCVTAPWSKIHPNKEKQLMSNKPLRGFIVSPRWVVISVCYQFCQ